MEHAVKINPFVHCVFWLFTNGFVFCFVEISFIYTVSRFPVYFCWCNGLPTHVPLLIILALNFFSTVISILYVTFLHIYIFTLMLCGSFVFIVHFYLGSPNNDNAIACCMIVVWFKNCNSIKHLDAFLLLLFKVMSYLALSLSFFFKRNVRDVNFSCCPVCYSFLMLLATNLTSVLSLTLWKQTWRLISSHSIFLSLFCLCIYQCCNKISFWDVKFYQFKYIVTVRCHTQICVDII